VRRTRRAHTPRVITPPTNSQAAAGTGTGCSAIAVLSRCGPLLMKVVAAVVGDTL
jgi:hypothetical protein